YSPSPASARLRTATATPQLYTPSLHDALPISVRHIVGGGAFKRDKQRSSAQTAGGIPDTVRGTGKVFDDPQRGTHRFLQKGADPDRKSTRLNSSHVKISYAVFCLKKKQRARTE